MSAGSLQLTTNPTGDACATADTADGGPGKMSEKQTCIDSLK